MFFEVDRLQNLVDSRVDIIDFFSEAFLKKLPDGELHFVSRDNLSCCRDGKPGVEVDNPVFRLKRSGKKREKRALARAVLSHDGNLGTAPYGKIHLIKDGFVVSVLKRDGVKAHNRFALCHSELAYLIFDKIESCYNVLPHLYLSPFSKGEIERG